MLRQFACGIWVQIAEHVHSKCLLYVASDMVTVICFDLDLNGYHLEFFLSLTEKRTKNKNRENLHR